MSVGAAGPGGGQPAAMAWQPEPSPRPCRDLCARGWRLLSLLAGFFPPSTTLLPYVTKFLQDLGQSQGAYERGFWTGARLLGEGLGEACDQQPGSSLQSWPGAASSTSSTQSNTAGASSCRPRAKCRPSWYSGCGQPGVLSLPRGWGAGAAGHGGLTLPPALAERENGPPASNSPAWRPEL